MVVPSTKSSSYLLQLPGCNYPATCMCTVVVESWPHLQWVETLWLYSNFMCSYAILMCFLCCFVVPLELRWSSAWIYDLSDHCNNAVCFHFTSYRVTHIGVCVGLLLEIFVPHSPLLPCISTRPHQDEVVWSGSVGQKTNMVWLGYRLLRLCTHRQQ